MSKLLKSYVFIQSVSLLYFLLKGLGVFILYQKTGNGNTVVGSLAFEDSYRYFYIFQYVSIIPIGGLLLLQEMGWFKSIKDQKITRLLIISLVLIILALLIIPKFSYFIPKPTPTYSV